MCSKLGEGGAGGLGIWDIKHHLYLTPPLTSRKVKILSLRKEKLRRGKKRNFWKGRKVRVGKLENVERGRRKYLKLTKFPGWWQSSVGMLRNIWLIWCKLNVNFNPDVFIKHEWTNFQKKKTLNPPPPLFWETMLWFFVNMRKIWEPNLISNHEIYWLTEIRWELSIQT